MIKKTITYTDYNGLERTEDFWFNLNETEITEMQLSIDGGYAAKIRQIINAKDQAEIIKLFKEIIFKAYGEKSDDGRRFIKSEELSIAFSQTEAYNKLFMELATNDEMGAEFINGIIPKKK